MELRFGRSVWPVELTAQQVLPLSRPPITPPNRPPAELVAAALEAPFGLESLRRAVTPDDQVVIVVDHDLPDLPGMIAAIVAHLAPAGISPSAITLLSPPGSPALKLPGLRHEIHDPDNRQRLAYVASTAAGRRVYLNRSLVEADFTIILGSRRYDPLSGYAGAEAAIFPALSDTETQASFAPPFQPDCFPHASQRHEAAEVAWLLGTPFLIHVIDGDVGQVQAVAAGLLDSSGEGMRLQDARWRATVPQTADLTIVCVRASQPGCVTLAAAAALAARVTEPGGRVVLLADDWNHRDPAWEHWAAIEAAPRTERVNRRAAPASPGPRSRRPTSPASTAPSPAAAFPARLWAWAADRTRLALSSPSDEQSDWLEDRDLTPIRAAADLQRLVIAAERLIIIPDAPHLLVQLASD